MPLTPGTRLGPYEILSPLGAGGMGEVYRARDSRLGRDVAIKVLAQHLSNSPEVRARFEREARTVSSLNHPHICVLYDVGREGSTDYLVLELVEGETLAARLARGALPPAEVLRLGAQIADALDRAHRAGVIHRDLKPGNVMLTRAGVKLMDFGLARAVGLTPEQASAGAMTQSPTMAQPLTAQGTLLGTFQYMSPEQLEGKEADARGDIWALGCVLYEMATGRRAFDGKSQASLIASIMNTEPMPLMQIAPLSPPALDRLVRACLAKDPEDRIQTAHDVKLQLQWVAEGGSPTAATSAPATRPMKTWWGWIAAGVLAVVAGVLSLFVLQKPAPNTAASWVSILPPESANIDDNALHVAVSPDATAIVFVATDSSGTSQLWIRELSGLQPKPLPGTAQATLPFWSPDSRFIGFFAEGTLKKVDREGRAVQSLCEAPDGRGAAWSSRGVILFAPSSVGGFSRVSEGGGTPSVVTRVDSTRNERGHRFPSFLRDGKHFLYLSLGPDSHLIKLGSLEGGKPTSLTAADGAGVFAAPDHVIFARAGTLLAQRLDSKRGRLVGAPKTLGEAPGEQLYAGAPPVSVSMNGVMVQRRRFPNLAGLSWLNREGQRTGTVPVTPAQYGEMNLSPDDDHLALTRFTASTSDIWTIELSRGVTTRLTSDLPVAEVPMWSPDGHWVTFSAISPSESKRNLYRVRPDGTGSPELFESSPNSTFLECGGWSMDGRYFLVRDLDKVTGEDIWVRREDEGDHKPVPLLHTRYQEETPRISPNGRWMAYRSDESGRSEIYVTAFPSLGAKHRISANGAGTQARSGFGYPFWRKDGKELIYVGGDGVSVISVPVETEADFHMGTPRVLFRLPPGTRDMVATSDLQRFLVLEGRGLKEGSSIQMLVNWPAAVNER
jgi:serine/threonine protein kinase